MNENSLMAKLTVKQKTQLIPHLRQRDIPADKLLFRQGDRVRCLYLLKEGRVRLEHPQGPSGRAHRGCLVGRVDSRPERHSSSATTETATVAYVIPKTELEGFFRFNPGTYVRFLAAARSEPLEVL